MITTREFTSEDKADFLVLHRECLAHYGIAPATLDQEARALDILVSGRHMSCLLAYKGGQPLGFATWALTLPAGSGVALYMKEIFVSSRVRGQGAGRALLAGLIDIATSQGCTRMDWQTDGDNSASQEFYAAINAPTHHKKTYRIMQDKFADFHKILTR